MAVAGQFIVTPFIIGINLPLATAGRQQAYERASWHTARPHIERSAHCVSTIRLIAVGQTNRWKLKILLFRQSGCGLMNWKLKLRSKHVPPRSPMNGLLCRNEELMCNGTATMHSHFRSLMPNAWMCYDGIAGQQQSELRWTAGTEWTPSGVFRMLSVCRMQDHHHHHGYPPLSIHT